MVNQSPLFYLEGFIYFLSKRWLALRFLNHQQSDSSVWKGRFTFWTYNHHPFRNGLKRKMSSEPKLQGITEPSRSSSGAVGVIRLWSRCFPESILQVTAESTSSKEAEVLLKRTKGVTMAFWKCFFWRIFVWKSQMLLPTFTKPKLHTCNDKYAISVCFFFFDLTHVLKSPFWWDVMFTICCWQVKEIRASGKPHYAHHYFLGMNVNIHAGCIYIYIHIFFLWTYIPPQDPNITIQHHKLSFFLNENLLSIPKTSPALSLISCVCRGGNPGQGKSWSTTEVWSWTGGATWAMKGQGSLVFEGICWGWNYTTHLYGGL